MPPFLESGADQAAAYFLARMTAAHVLFVRRQCPKITYQKERNACQKVSRVRVFVDRTYAVFGVKADEYDGLIANQSGAANFSPRAVDKADRA
jgi:hypothetical protein